MDSSVNNHDQFVVTPTQKNYPPLHPVGGEGKGEGGLFSRQRVIIPSKKEKRIKEVIRMYNIDSR